MHISYNSIYHILVFWIPGLEGKARKLLLPIDVNILGVDSSITSREELQWYKKDIYLHHEEFKDSILYIEPKYANGGHRVKYLWGQIFGWLR